LVRDALIQLISQAIEELVEKQVIDPSIKSIPIEIEPPKQADHGDFATNFCLVASKTAKTNPRALAETLLPAILAISQNRHPHVGGDPALENQGSLNSSLPAGEGKGWGINTQNIGNPETSPLLSAEIAGPGFINFRLNPAWAAQFLTEVLENPTTFYKPKNDNPQKINVEFVSVNPNGPITIGSGRGAAFGSALCNVLEAAGNTVHREYYINDGVNSEQMRLFAESVKAIIEGRPVPDNGYKGDYVHEVASTLCNFDSLLHVEVELKELQSLLFPTIHTGSSQPHPEAVLLDGTALDHIDVWDRRIKVIKHLKLQVEQNTKTFATLPLPDQIEICTVVMTAIQRKALSTFQVNFDTWFSEQSLHDSGVVEQELQHLLATNVADDAPTRTKVVFAKGGIIKEVLKEVQPIDGDLDNVEGFPPQDWGGQGGVDKESLGGTGETYDPLPRTGEGQGGIDQNPASKTIWLRSTKFGDDQDRVLKRADGRLTYIASDVAYHKDKFNRPANADKLITVLGPDHHGYIARLTAVVAAMFSDQVAPLVNPEPLTEHEALIYTSIAERNQCQAALAWAKDHLEVQIFQIVRFLKDGKPAPMRKRDGNIYALIDLINEIGETLKPDGTTEEKQQAGSGVARFFYLMRHHDTAMDFDLELATKQSDENPVFYVQYAHARICSVIDRAIDEGISLPIGEGKGWGHSASPLPTGEGLRERSLEYLHLLQHPKELALILKICDLQNEIARTAEDYSVNRLTTYAIELARTYHSFYDSCRVIQPDQPELSRARLALCEATRTALQAALELLGVSAPNRMDRAERPT
jgi:arginyl-tRNA synthetase